MITMPLRATLPGPSTTNQPIRHINDNEIDKEVELDQAYI